MIERFIRRRQRRRFANSAAVVQKGASTATRLVARGRQPRLRHRVPKGRGAPGRYRKARGLEMVCRARFAKRILMRPRGHQSDLPRSRPLLHGTNWLRRSAHRSTRSLVIARNPCVSLPRPHSRSETWPAPVVLRHRRVIDRVAWGVQCSSSRARVSASAWNAVLGGACHSGEKPATNDLPISRDGADDARPQRPEVPRR